jgi:predicted RNA-binding Zn ribbon-like protein
LTGDAVDGYGRGVPQGFQPGGRPPAPAPLDLVQDFVNTEIPDWNRDDLATPDALAAWLRHRGLLAAREGVDADTFATARALRSALRALALANTLGEPPAPDRRAAIEATLAAFPLAVRLTGSAPGLAPAADGAAAPLGQLVAIVAEAQLVGDWERMKACRQETCGWLFYDGSRNRSSSWCSMRICGGREKARAYRRKRAVREGRA